MINRELKEGDKVVYNRKISVCFDYKEVLTISHIEDYRVYFKEKSSFTSIDNVKLLKPTSNKVRKL